MSIKIPLTVTLSALLATTTEPLLASDGEHLAQKYLLVDTHVDVPYRIHAKWADVTRGTEGGDFDAIRARQGGLDVPFMSIYIPAKLEKEKPGGSYQLAHQLIDSVEAMVTRNPEGFMLARSPEEASAARASGKIGLAMGMENGSPLDGKLERVAEFKKRGINYITLAHSLANHISDSSYDLERPNEGLSDFGKALIPEMNRQGVMVDVSHVSDAAFWQVMELSRVPVIASHSSARHFTPGFERNMSDDMIKAMAERGGLIMINFGSGFITAEARAWRDAYTEVEKAWKAELGREVPYAESAEFLKAYRKKHAYPFADLDDVLDHFDHVVELVGIESVGIGSDYDGVGDSLPTGLKDVSAFPNLIDGLLERGYKEQDIALIMGGNLMRVWAQVVSHSQAGASAHPGPLGESVHSD